MGRGMNKIELKYRVSYHCECGAHISCKPKASYRRKKCPACCAAFRVPLPGPDFWSVEHGLSEIEYSLHAKALVEFATSPAASESKYRRRDVLALLEAIEIIRLPSTAPTCLPNYPENSSPLERDAQGPVFGGAKSPHRRLTKWA